MGEKKILIFGGSGSIGLSIAKEVIKLGYKPHLIGRNYSTLNTASNELNCEFTIADVTKSKELENAIQKCGENIYGLAYCVGSITLKPISSAHENDYIDSFKTNTLGAIMSVKVAADVLNKNKGSIIFFSTIAVKQGFINHSIVSTAKGGIEALTVSLAAEFAPNIRVNCIAPSITESNMSKSIISNENIKKAIESLHPIPKIGEADDHSKLAAFLLSESNSWITGQVFHIDGGRSTVRKKG